MTLASQKKHQRRLGFGYPTAFFFAKIASIREYSSIRDLCIRREPFFEWFLAHTRSTTRYLCALKGIWQWLQVLYIHCVCNFIENEIYHVRNALLVLPFTVELSYLISFYFKNCVILCLFVFQPCCWQSLLTQQLCCWPLGFFPQQSNREAHLNTFHKWKWGMSETILFSQTNYYEESLIKTLWREAGNLVLDIGNGNGKIINTVAFIVYDSYFQYKRF